MGNDLKLIGYWIESLDDQKYKPPQEFVCDLGEATRARLTEYLDAGALFAAYRGISWCRFGCSHAMGNRELTDGKWVWPEGLGHYVSAHFVGLPIQFISHVASGGSKASAPIPISSPDESFWLAWCETHSAKRLQSRIQEARRLADLRAEEIRNSHRQKLETERGLSDSTCVQKGCLDTALKGMAFCSTHALLLRFDTGMVAYRERIIEVLNSK